MLVSHSILVGMGYPKTLYGVVFHEGAVFLGNVYHKDNILFKYK